MDYIQVVEQFPGVVSSSEKSVETKAECVLHPKVLFQQELHLIKKSPLHGFLIAKIKLQSSFQCLYAKFVVAGLQ